MSTNYGECFEYFTVMRPPADVKALLDWAKVHYVRGGESENPYAAGVLATLQYLMRESDFPPQNYKGEFTLENVLRHADKG